MKTYAQSFLLATLLGVVFTVKLAAQPAAFTYQGSLEDNGSPASGIYDLRFSIHEAETNGTSLGVVTNTATDVTDGLFTVTLDFGGAVFDGSDRWLEIGVATNGGGSFSVLSPRQYLSATPYAVRAGNSSSAEAVSGPISAGQLTGTISSNHIGANSITSAMLADGAVGTDQLANDAVTAEKVSTTTDWFLTRSLRDATPSSSDQFGCAVAGVGGDKLLVGASGDNTGASGAGVAYLYSLDGSLLTTFTNPTPDNNEAFGKAVAGIGPGTVIIGANRDEAGGVDAGAAYLYSTNGTLLNTFSNPTPQSADNFGFAVAGVGADKVLIGAFGDDIGAGSAGIAYLYSTNGTLLTTLTNPTPEIGDSFGTAVAGVGSDRVLVGSGGNNSGAIVPGAAYLFSIDGALLTTFSNPTLEGSDFFGNAVAAIGSNRVLVGAPYSDVGAEDAGSAYLFDTNGILLATFTKPTPDTSFGGSVAGVGDSTVVIGAAADDFAAVNAGAAFVFEQREYAEGVVVEGVAPQSITSVELAGGAVTAEKVSDLHAESLTLGTLDDARLSSNVPLLDKSQLFRGVNNFTSFDNGFSGTFRGNFADSASAPSFTWVANADTGLFRPSAHELAISTAGAERLRIDDVGRVGIGTSAPQSKLHVAGGVTASAFHGAGSDSASAPSFSWSGDSNTGMFRSGTDELALSTAGTERLNITAQGNVSIGIAGGSNDGSLHVQNASGSSRPIKCDRVGSDGQLLAWARDDGVVGSVTVSGGVVSYNAFTGSHYAWCDPEPEPGTLMRLTGRNRSLHPDGSGEVVYGVEPTAQANDPACLGACLATSKVEGGADATAVRLVAAVGNGEVWVADTGRDIRPGDYLISSDVPGHAILDDRAEPQSHIIGRAGQGVHWSDVSEITNGVKHKKISILFGAFTRDNRAAPERIVQLESRLAELEALVSRLSPQSSEMLVNNRTLKGNDR